MANERTFLAWLRTSLSFITIGIGTAQLFKLQDSTKLKINQMVLELTPNSLASYQMHSYPLVGKILGSIFITLGIAVLVFGILRFYQVQHLLTYGYYPATRKSIIVLVSLIIIIMISTLIIVVKNYH